MVSQHQYDALKEINKELISLCWDIGKMIVERQEKNGWGKAVVEHLLADLQKEFTGMRLCCVRIKPNFQTNLALEEVL